MKACRGVVTADEQTIHVGLTGIGGGVVAAGIMMPVRVCEGPGYIEIVCPETAREDGRRAKAHLEGLIRAGRRPKAEEKRGLVTIDKAPKPYGYREGLVCQVNRVHRMIIFTTQI